MISDARVKKKEKVITASHTSTDPLLALLKPT